MSDLFRPTLGDIGEPARHIEIEPVPLTEPIPEPAVVPAQPVKVPEPEPVGA